MDGLVAQNSFSGNRDSLNQAVEAYGPPEVGYGGPSHGCSFGW